MGNNNRRERAERMERSERSRVFEVNTVRISTPSFNSEIVPLHQQENISSSMPYTPSPMLSAAEMNIEDSINMSMTDTHSDQPEEFEDPQPVFMKEFFASGRGIVDLLVDEEHRDALEDELDRLVCPICHEPFQDPMVLIPCGHELCRFCLAKLKHSSRSEVKCPECRKPMIRNISYTPARRTTMFLTQKKYNVHCIFHFTSPNFSEPRTGGCTEIVPISMLSTHVATCRFQPDPPPEVLPAPEVSLPQCFIDLPEGEKNLVNEYMSTRITRETLSADSLQKFVSDLMDRFASFTTMEDTIQYLSWYISQDVME